MFAFDSGLKQSTLLDREQCEILLPESIGIAHSVDVLDIAGRQAGRFTRIESTRWAWSPERSTPPGLYFIRAGKLTARAIYVR